MRMLLRPEYLNGQFGDPALYVWELNERDALLIDCGDLSQFTPKQLLKVKTIFISHCHMDHFFGFDSFLRIHMGMDKAVTLYGPPGLSQRLAGKLQGYTWNLIHDQNLEFIAIDLDEEKQQITTTHFHSQDQFHPQKTKIEYWNPKEPILNTSIFQVKTTTLDHRTPSMAYSVEEKVTVTVNLPAMRELGLKADTWIGDLKHLFLFDGFDKKEIQVPLERGGFQVWKAAELGDRILNPRQRHKIAYATDGAAHEDNRHKLHQLVHGADLFLSETCFLQEDVALADATKHFTAAYIGDVAREAQVKLLAPFHFSKRYLKNPQRVLDEAQFHFRGDVLNLAKKLRD